MQSQSPLIITLRLNEEAFNFFNALRQKFFPPERNFLSAHLTLFHHLPPNEVAIAEELQILSQQQPTLVLSVTDVVSIGKGVAYKIDCPPLVQLHKRMQEKWQHWLIPQDKQKLWPHVTVQNKVTAQVAKETLSELKASFQPFTATGIAFDLWQYEGGPWTFLKSHPFAA
jgi:hypothetical protein